MTCESKKRSWCASGLDRRVNLCMQADCVGQSCLIFPIFPLPWHVPHAMPSHMLHSTDCYVKVKAAKCLNSSQMMIIIRYSVNYILGHTPCPMSPRIQWLLSDVQRNHKHVDLLTVSVLCLDSGLFCLESSATSCDSAFIAASQRIWQRKKSTTGWHPVSCCEWIPCASLKDPLCDS